MDCRQQAAKALHRKICRSTKELLAVRCGLAFDRLLSLGSYILPLAVTIGHFWQNAAFSATDAEHLTSSLAICRGDNGGVPDVPVQSNTHPK